MKAQKVSGGWLTCEYGLMPAATHERCRREASAGKQGGRTMEIQRLIGRSLRGVVDLEALGENTFYMDCDVFDADGGTRCCSISGASVALQIALRKDKRFAHTCKAARQVRILLSQSQEATLLYHFRQIQKLLYIPVSVLRS